jgi:hypothetical protein
MAMYHIVGDFIFLDNGSGSLVIVMVGLENKSAVLISISAKK